MTDHPEVRRDAEEWAAAEGEDDDLAFVRVGLIRSLLAELEQAERERDEWKAKAEGVQWGDLSASMTERERADAAEQREAALVEALRDMTDLVIWMSGSPSFSPEGEAHEGWKKRRDGIDKAVTVLAAHEQAGT